MTHAYQCVRQQVDEEASKAVGNKKQVAPSQSNHKESQQSRVLKNDCFKAVIGKKLDSEVRAFLLGERPIATATHRRAE